MQNALTNILNDRRLACGALAAASALVLITALGSQYIGGLAPCALCLIQRWPHVAVIVFGWVGYKPNVTDEQRRRLLWLMALCLLGTGGVALWHAGIEYGLYTGPSSCTGTVSGTDIAELRKQLMASDIVRCDEIPWSLFGISLAGYNAIFSLATAGAAIFAARSREEAA